MVQTLIAKGIDISSHQGKDIDFQKVKAAGYSFVIIKAGQHLSEMASFKTLPEYRYVQRVQEAGLDWGAYWWSDAVTVAEAKREAEAFLAALEGLRPTYPVYMDQEYNSPPDRLGLGSKARQLRTDMVKAFLDTLQDAGYYAGLYSSLDWINTRLYDKQLTAYDKWIAQYYTSCQYTGNYGMWQHHGDLPGYVGRVDGIGVPVDLNDCYRDYPAIMREHGLNGFKPGGGVAPGKPDYEALYKGCKADYDQLRREVAAFGRKWGA